MFRPLKVTQLILSSTIQLYLTAKQGQVYKKGISPCGFVDITLACEEDKMVSTTPLLSTVGEDLDDVDVKEPKIKTEEFLEYSKTIHDEDDPKLITIRGSSTEYLEARRDLGKIMRRSFLQQGYLVVNETMFKVKNLQNKIYSTEADIEIIYQNGPKGQCKLTIYKDNKKKVGKKTRLS